MLTSSQSQYVDFVINALQSKAKHNKTALEKEAAKHGILDQNQVKELTELAIVLRARFLAHEPNKTIRERFNNIVELYSNQTNLSHRTSQSMLLQQYSTPAPIAYLMGVFCGIDKPGYYFEPSAGNGLLTIAGNEKDFVVNEIEDFRNNNLKSQNYSTVLQMDASKALPYSFHFDAILTNPPFGKLNKEIKLGQYSFNTLDHVMAIYALSTLKQNGKAAIIIGGHQTWDEKGRIQSGKNRTFFSWLHENYNVLDVLNIDGHKLYSRQGTAFDTRLILIHGRKSPNERENSFAPLFDKSKDYEIQSFDELYNRIIKFVNIEEPQTDTLELEAEALSLELELLSFEGLGGYIQTEILKVKSIYSSWVSSQLLKKYYKENLIGLKVKNLETSIEIEFKSYGLNKSIFGRKNKAGQVVKVDNIIATAIHYLPELLRFGVFIKHSYALKQNHLKIKGKVFWNFLCKINIDNSTYYLIVPVLETTHGKFQYSIEYAEIKKSVAGLRAKKQ